MDLPTLLFIIFIAASASVLIWSLAKEELI
jgi:hypothetical protein